MHRKCARFKQKKETVKILNIIKKKQNVNYFNCVNMNRPTLLMLTLNDKIIAFVRVRMCATYVYSSFNTLHPHTYDNISFNNL